MKRSNGRSSTGLCTRPDLGTVSHAAWRTQSTAEVVYGVMEATVAGVFA